MLLSQVGLLSTSGFLSNISGDGSFLNHAIYLLSPQSWVMKCTVTSHKRPLDCFDKWDLEANIIIDTL